MKRDIILYKRYFVFFNILIFINLVFNGCYSLQETSIENNQTIKVYRIETSDNKIIDFQNNKLGYALLSNNEIVSFKIDGEQEVYPISTIKKYYTEKFDVNKTVWLMIGSAAALCVLFFTMIIIGMDGRGFGG